MQYGGYIPRKGRRSGGHRIGYRPGGRKTPNVIPLPVRVKENNIFHRGGEAAVMKNIFFQFFAGWKSTLALLSEQVRPKGESL